MTILGLKMFKIILLILLISPLSLNGQSNGLIEVRKLIHESSGIWPREKLPEIEAMLENLTLQDLVELMQTENSLEKIYGFWGYVRKENGDYRKYFPALVRDTAKVSEAFQQCNWKYPTAVGKYVFDIAEDLRGYGGYVTFPEFLDSMAFEIASYEDIRGNINCRIMNLQAPPNLYDKVRERALKGDTPAIIGLSSYQKEQDIPIIINLLQTEYPHHILYGLMCVEKFPHPAFEKDILSIYYRLMNKQYPLGFSYLCQILRKYNTLEAEKAFSTVISNPDKYPNQFVLLWLSFERSNEHSHPMRTRMEKSIGKNEIKKRVAEFEKLDYWKLSNDEINN